jgi:putative membrane protein
MRQRFETPLKALLLIGLGLFLYSRLANGTLDFYINRRFWGFTLLAVVGLIVVGLSYRPGRRPPEEHGHDLEHDHTHEHSHEHEGHVHSHGLTWGGVALVLLPIVLGIAVPPQPLGASALANREINSGVNPSTGASSWPGAIKASSQKTTTEMNILDWWQTFRASPDLNTDSRILNQEARVVGFVYQDRRYGEDHFLVTRYVVSCCVADASALGLVVAWPDSPKLQNDQWVEVSGVFARSSLDAWQMPILVARTVTPVAVPGQPYLYP